MGDNEWNDRNTITFEEEVWDYDSMIRERTFALKIIESIQ